VGILRWADEPESTCRFDVGACSAQGLSDFWPICLRRIAGESVQIGTYSSGILKQDVMGEELFLVDC
jgi:hypothetical protein